MADEREEKGLSDILKTLIKDLPVAKETIGQVAKNAKDVKGEVSKLLQDELHKYLGKLEVDKVVDHIVENYDIDAKLSFKKKPKKKSSNSNSNLNLNKDE